MVEGGARLADLMAIAAADEGVFMINRSPSAAARDIISRAFLSEFNAAIARHDPLAVSAKFLADFDANLACAGVDVPIEEVSPRVDAASEDDLQSVSDLVCPNTVLVQPGNFAEPLPRFRSPLRGPSMTLAAWPLAWI
ncbi:hypothetical protein [Bradyrhizobium sp. AS23.2]|uniref:hypothetical protein n=1 Tax=Bradyrhizobium sp. AS23.2 TaxID=1680155 RepID=UPI00093FEAEC|nr:hypothetical protein [Bradyrhizobium sp. AS23.2]OKO79816.1 hypothetical protein AC630_16755 [Bradyrhizobium sp. AS23.2]